MVNASNEESDYQPGRGKPEMDLEKLVDRQANQGDEQSESERLKSAAAKAPMPPVEAPATPYPEQGKSIADMADDARSRANSGR